MSYDSLRGQSILVTGATSGIGRVTALALAQAGAHVTITGRRATEGALVVAEIKKHGVKAAFVQGSVADEAHVIKAVETAAGLTGKLDGAFNNAGVESAMTNTADDTSEEFRRVFDINVLGVMLSMKHEIRAMLKTGGGSIVNNASIAGRVGMPGFGIYIASKHAVLGLTKSAALEVAKQNIRVNAVSPGGIETDMLDRFTGGNADAATYMANLHPIGRVGKSEEIAKPVLFLLSSESAFITGHDLLVDGGFTVP